MAERDTHFARLVSLACHDLRTPLATVHGFARTLTRLDDVGDPVARYLAMIEAASTQLAELLDELGLAARIQGDRWEPNLQPLDLGGLAAEAFADVDAGEVALSGDGGRPVVVDGDAARSSLRALALCLLRHGGLERLEGEVRDGEVRLAPVAAGAAPIVLGEDLRDLGAAVAVRVVAALGGSVGVDGETLVVRLPAARDAG